MTKKATAPGAAAGAAAPAPAATAQATKAKKPDHHLPTQRLPRDEYTGIGGQYKRDPATGKRVPVKPAAPSAEGDDTTTTAAA